MAYRLPSEPVKLYVPCIIGGVKHQRGSAHAVIIGLGGHQRSAAPQKIDPSEAANNPVRNRPNHLGDVASETVRPTERPA